MKIDNYSSVIWDWNGTIIDDVAICHSIFIEEQKRFSLPLISLSDYRDKFTFPVSNFYTNMGFEDSEELYTQIAKRFGESYLRLRNSAPIHRGVVQLLDRLKESGYKQYILSAYKDDKLKYMVKERNLESYFSLICGISDNRAGSKKEVGLKLVKEKEIDIKTTLFIGDTTHDYDVAMDLGATPVIVASGHNSRKQLEDYGVKWVIDNVEEIFDIS